MFKRIKNLEEAIAKEHLDIKLKDDELDLIYHSYLESVKE